MKWLERHLGRYAIPNLSLVIIILYGFGYLLNAVNSQFLNYLTLNPYAIAHGQIWRLVTWLVVPPSSSNIFFVLIAMMFYYSIGSALEHVWGTFRYNYYIISGVVYTILGAIAVDLIAYALYGDMMTPVMYQFMSYYFSTYYVCMSIFLAYAATFPDATVLFMYILPVKVKWLGILYAVMMLYDAVRYATSGGWYICVAMAVSLLNFVIFFLQTRDWKRYSPKEVHRRNSWKRQTSGKTINGKWRDIPSGQNTTGPQAEGSTAKAAGPVHMKGSTTHKCAICGRTDVSDPELEFRYCSKCEGGYEFCQDHLFTHEHARNGSAPTLMAGPDVTIEHQ